MSEGAAEQADQAKESSDSTASAGRAAGTGTDDYAELKAAIKNERDARKAAEKSAADFQARIDALESKDKSDVERLTAERDKLKTDLDSREARLRELAITTALTSAATKSGARYPELIVDRLRSQAEIDDDLTVTNAESLVTTAKREYPDLFRVVDGGADGGKRDSLTDDSTLRGASRLAHAHAQRSRK